MLSPSARDCRVAGGGAVWSRMLRTCTGVHLWTPTGARRMAGGAVEVGVEGVAAWIATPLPTLPGATQGTSDGGTRGLGQGNRGWERRWPLSG